MEKLVVFSFFLSLSSFELIQGEERNDAVSSNHGRRKTCPTWDHQSTLECTAEKFFSPCTVDHQCTVGGKCCAVSGCRLKYCVDTTEGFITEPKAIGLADILSRQKRQLGVCVSCSCIRSCETDADCNRGSRRQCYHNACSSYCIRPWPWRGYLFNSIFG